MISQFKLNINDFFKQFFNKNEWISYNDVPDTISDFEIMLINFIVGFLIGGIFIIYD
jgi:hypothetical protein